MSAESSYRRSRADGGTEMAFARRMPGKVRHLPNHRHESTPPEETKATPGPALVNPRARTPHSLVPISAAYGNVKSLVSAAI